MLKDLDAAACSRKGSRPPLPLPGPNKATLEVGVVLPSV